MKKMFAEKQKVSKFASAIVPWCNGNTPVFGTVIQGSSPCGTTAVKPLIRVAFLFKSIFVR